MRQQHRQVTVPYVDGELLARLQRVSACALIWRFVVVHEAGRVRTLVLDGEVTVISFLSLRRQGRTGGSTGPVTASRLRGRLPWSLGVLFLVAAIAPAISTAIGDVQQPLGADCPCDQGVDAGRVAPRLGVARGSALERQELVNPVW